MRLAAKTPRGSLETLLTEQKGRSSVLSMFELTVLATVGIAARVALALLVVASHQKVTRG